MKLVLVLIALNLVFILKYAGEKAPEFSRNVASENLERN